MRHIVGHFSDLSHQFFNTVKHSVEVFGQLVPFVPGPSKRYPLAEPALHDCSSCGVDGFDAPDRAPRHRDTREGGENECQCRPAGCGSGSSGGSLAAGVRVWQVMSRGRAPGAGQPPLEGASVGSPQRRRVVEPGEPARARSCAAAILIQQPGATARAGQHVQPAFARCPGCLDGVLYRFVLRLSRPVGDAQAEAISPRRRRTLGTAEMDGGVAVDSGLLTARNRSIVPARRTRARRPIRCDPPGVLQPSRRVGRRTPRWPKGARLVSPS